MNALMRMTAGAAAVMMLGLVAGPAAGDGLAPIDRHRKVPIGRTTKVYLNERLNDRRYEIIYSRVTARSPGRKPIRGKNSVRLPAGRWKVTRTFTFESNTLADSELVTFTPATGQCAVTGGHLYESSLVTDVTANCLVDGRTVSITVGSIYSQPGGSAWLVQVPAIGADLVTVLADPASYESYSPVKAITVGPQSVWVDVPRADLGPFTVTQRDTVKVREYNPGCVTWAERAHLRIGVSRAYWHRIIGGSGTVEAEASGGVQIRKYRGCWWTSLDQVTVRYVAGSVDAYSVVH